MVEQAASAAAEAEPPAPERAEPAVSAAPAPAAAPARSRSLPSRAAAGGATTLVLPSPAPDRPPEPALIKPEPRPDPTPETRTEPAGSKPLTLPTQYRAAAGPTALVMLAISPWGEVLVDGKMVGVSPPMNELELSPGKHRIEVRNGAFKPYRTEVDLGPNETTRIKHKFLQGR
jgi:serine/threonine-protein kinase